MRYPLRHRALKLNNKCVDPIFPQLLMVGEKRDVGLKLFQMLLALKEEREALLGVEPRISCLLDRHFDQLSHSACYTELFLCISTPKHEELEAVVFRAQVSARCGIMIVGLRCLLLTEVAIGRVKEWHLFLDQTLGADLSQLGGNMQSLAT